jgi:uncharacterized membrane protein YphA (DoxX/SURF4 family)
MAHRIFGALVALLLAGFFLFVGWNKGFAPVSDLARHHAWTVFLPEWAGRLVGWSEMACALALVAGLWPRWAPLASASALVLIANQAVAAAVHWQHGETASLPQNAVLILLLALVVRLSLARPNPSLKGECL